MAKNEGQLVKLSDSDKVLARSEEDIRGHDVHDRHGEDLGKVDDLLIDPEESKVRFLVVASGGFLGLGEHKSYIPVDAVQRVGRSTVQVDLEREHVAGAPKYDPDLDEERDYFQGVYGYYGFTPYWNAAYEYPRYPFYP